MGGESSFCFDSEKKSSEINMEVEGFNLIVRRVVKLRILIAYLFLLSMYAFFTRCGTKNLIQSLLLIFTIPQRNRYRSYLYI